MGYRCCEEDLGKDPDLIRRGTVEPQTLWIPQQSQAVVQSGGPPERSEEEAWFKTGPAILVLHVSAFPIFQLITSFYTYLQAVQGTDAPSHTLPSALIKVDITMAAFHR